jgi:hypothetical protein
MVQFRARPLSLLIEPVGGFLSDVVVALKSAEQPPFHTVTDQVPAEETVIDCVPALLDHMYAVPAGAVNTVEGTVQFRARPLLAEILPEGGGFTLITDVPDAAVIPQVLMSFDTPVRV